MSRQKEWARWNTPEALLEAMACVVCWFSGDSLRPAGGRWGQGALVSQERPGHSMCKAFIFFFTVISLALFAVLSSKGSGRRDPVGQMPGLG